MNLIKFIQKILGIDKVNKSISNIEKDISILSDNIECIHSYAIEIIGKQDLDTDKLIELAEQIKSKIASIPREITVKNVLAI